MTLGAAIFASVVLVLLVYNKPFRKASAWAAGVLTGIALIGGLGWYAYVKYQDYTQAKQAAAHKKQVDACVARYSASDYGKTDKWVDYLDVPATCENDPNKDWSSKSTFNPDAPYRKVLEIHDGDTLKNASGVIPLVYLGHGQKMVLACESFGEHKKPTPPRVDKGIISCPTDESTPVQHVGRKRAVHLFQCRQTKTVSPKRPARDSLCRCLSATTTSKIKESTGKHYLTAYIKTVYALFREEHPHQHLFERRPDGET